jgi:CRISPR/Cas system endoribonuclease Cas6 (RAMP superfamily)
LEITRRIIIMTMLISLNLSVVPLKDVIPPPLTSKIIKYMIEVRGPEWLKNLLNRKGPFKPITITQLFLGSIPLYSKSKNSAPIRLKANTVFHCWINAVKSDALGIEEIPILTGKHITPYGDFLIDVNQVEVINISSLDIQPRKYVKLTFLTPIVITTKHMLPPTLKSKAKILPERHKLVPTPSYLISYLLKLWNNLVDPEDRIPGPAAGDWEAYKLGRLADVLMPEIDYRIKGETAVIGKDNSGKLRLVRGFTGWVIYEFLHKKFAQQALKLIKLGTYMGVGRSRAIGLGQMRAIYLSTDDAKTKVLG